MVDKKIIADKKRCFIKLPQQKDDEIFFWFYTEYNAKTKEWFIDLFDAFEIITMKRSERKPKESEYVLLRCFGMYRTQYAGSNFYKRGWSFIDDVLPYDIYEKHLKQQA